MENEVIKGVLQADLPPPYPRIRGARETRGFGKEPDTEHGKVGNATVGSWN